MPTPTFKLLVDDIDLTLVEFDGQEEMNRLFKYTFTTEIPSGKKLSDVINGDAVFTIKEFDTSLHSGDIGISGYISKASKSNGYWVLEFLPKLQKTTTNSRSEIYFKEDSSLTVKDIIEEEFDTDITLNDRTPIYNITATLPTRKLFCQFHESNLNFVARLCDHWGFQFYFDHYTSQIVFADDTSYDQEFKAELKTTNSSATNALLTISDWQESLKNPLSYSTVTGYNSETAGTPITASYPTNGASLSGVTEAVEILADISSQQEAEYIAQVRHESINCLNHLASGKVKIPYLYPGFLINTDDSDFAKALIIKTTTTARNLNSTNTGTSPSFICDFQAIPDTILFRPNKFYTIPSATNVIGKVISETDDTTKAQRNEIGEYKAELLGFENETSTHPWLRKAQTTAGTNSNDMPLTPGTEVLISFIDNNPNCPYIQHALENSLHPAPVTNKNAQVALISTDGILAKSSQQGRYNYSTTKVHSEPSDSDISGSIKNYFAERSSFSQHENFIDPSSTTAIGFSQQDEISGEYIMTRHYGDSVEIREGDKLHWHNGNLYDFGGYWNYNLGNSYEENYLDQASPINVIASPFSGTDVSVADILEEGGPDFKSVQWPTIPSASGDNDDDSNKADFSDSDHPFAKPTTASDAPFYKDNVNTSKTFKANSYEFSTECNSIEISDRCNSLEITHVDGDTKSVEAKFKNGRIRSLEKSQHRYSSEKKWGPTGKLLSRSETTKLPNSGNFTEIKTKEKNWTIDGSTLASESTTSVYPSSVMTDEKSYNMNTGALASHNIKTTDGMGTAEMDFSFDASAASKFNFGASTSFSLSAQADASLAISFSGNAAINVGFGLDFELKTGAEAGLSLDLRTGIEAGINSKGKIEMSGIGFKARAESRVEAEKKAIAMEALTTELTKCAMTLAYTDVKLMKVTLQLKAGLEITGM